MSKTWKCMTCETISRFKGLCRDCSDYDSEGQVVTPVHRVRLDEWGEPWQPKEREPRNISHEMFVMSRRASRRVTKKQQRIMQEQLKQEQERIRAVAQEGEASEDGLMEIGEEVHVHGPNCGHDHHHEEE